MNRTRKNIILAIILQLVTIIHGFIIPRVILLNFGSEVNGLISSISQFLNYIQLFEGGIGAVIMASLYKPLSENDTKTVSSIIVAAERFFRQIAIIYIGYSLIVAIVFPIFVNSDFSYKYIFWLVLIISFTTIIQYLFAISYRILLNADKRGYIVSSVQIVFLIVNLCAVLISIKVFPSIHLIKILSALAYLISPIVFNIYVKNHYSIEKDCAPNEEALKQRWNAFGQNFAFFVHNNTDIVVLTILSTLANISVYSVYTMIINSLKSLIKSISDAIAPSMGKILVSENSIKINKAFDYYELGMTIICTVSFICCGILIVPFVQIYTAGINDANYSQPIFGIILTIAYFIYCYRDCYGNVIYAAGHIKETSNYAYIEAAINLVLSISFVSNLGLVGIALGTCVAMLYRMIAMVLYANKRILKRKNRIWIINSTSICFSTILCVIITLLIQDINFVMNSIINWLILASIVFIISIVTTLFSLFLFRHNILLSFIRTVFKK